MYRFMTALIRRTLLSSAVALSLTSPVQAHTCDELSRRVTEIQTAYGTAFSPASLTLSQQRIWNEWELLCQAPPQAVSCQDLVQPMRDVKAVLSAPMSTLNSDQQRTEILWRAHCQSLYWRDQLAKAIDDKPLPYYPPQPGCRTYGTPGSSTLVCVSRTGAVFTSECYTTRGGGITCTSSGQ
jgi:hypothetical protein